MPGVGIGVSPTLLRFGFPFDPSQLTGLLAWFDPSEGKTGDPITAHTRKAGTGLSDLSSPSGPADNETSLGFDKTNDRLLFVNNSCNTLHEDGFVAFFLVNLTSLTGFQALFDSCARNASSGRRGAHIGVQNGIVVLLVSNGGGTFVVDLGSGSAYGSPQIADSEWQLVEIAWSPDWGAYIRLNGGLPVTGDAVGSPSVGNPLYRPTMGTAISAIDWLGGELGDHYWAEPSLVEDEVTLSSLRAYLAATQGLALDSAEAVSGSGDTDTVLV